MNTDDVIETLARDLQPVTPLRPPAVRAGAWLAGTALYAAALALYSAGSGITAALSEPHLWLPEAAALATGALAAFAAFASVVPGHPRRAAAWLAVAALIWVAILVAGAAPRADLAAVLGTRDEWECVRFIAAGGAPPLAVLLMLLRRGAPLHRFATAALAAVAAGALLSVAACAARPHEDGAITLVWHGAAIFAVVLVCVACAGAVFDWRGTRSRGRTRA